MGTRKSSRVDSHKKKKTSRPRARPGGEYKTPKAQRRRGGDRLTAPATPSRSQYSDKLRQTCELKRETRLPYDFDQTHSLKCVKCNTVGRWVARTGYAERCAGVWLYKCQGSIQEPGTDIRVSCPNWVRPNQPPVPDWLKHKIKAVRDLDAKGAANDSSPSTLGSKIDSAVGSLGTSTSPEQLESDHAYAQSLYAQEVAQYEPRQGASDEAGPSGSRTAPAAFDTTKSTSQGLTAKRKAAQLQQEATDELDQMRHNKFIQTLKGTNNVVISRQDMSSPEQSPEPSTPSPAARRPTSATAIGNTTSASGPVRNASSQVAEKPSAPIMPRKRSMSCISISSTEEPTVVVKRERHDSVLSLSDDEPAEHERHDSVLSLSDDEPAGRERHRMSDSTLESSNKENHVPATTKKVFALVKTIPFVTFTSTPKKPSRQTSQLQSPREASADVFHPDEDDASPMPPDKSDVYDISPTVSELAKEATLDEPRYVPGTPGADEKSLSPIGQSLLPRNRARNDLPENDDIPRARNRNPRSGPWKPPLECTDDTKAPYDTDYEDSDAPVTPERPADTPLPSSNGPAVSDIYGPLIRSVIQLRAHVDALPPDARAKVVATVTKFHEETGTVADLMALLPSPSSGSGKDKHEESPSDTNTRNKNAGASSSNALENRAGNEAKVADDGSEEDSDGDVDIEESDAEANHLESDDDGEVAAPEANDEPWYLAAMIWERPAKGVDIFCFDPDLSVAWYLETVLWVDSFSQPKIHFLSIPYTEDDVVLELRSNLGLVLRHFDVTSVEVWKPDIYTWVEQSVTTPIHVHGQDDKLLLLRLPDVGYCQGFLKFFERMECDQTGSDVMANALQRDGGFSWQEKGKGVDRGDNR